MIFQADAIECFLSPHRVSAYPNGLKLYQDEFHMDRETGSIVHRRHGQTKQRLLQFTSHDGAVDDEDDDELKSSRRPITRREYLLALRWWHDEYRYAAVCVASVALLGLLLRRYDQQPVPDLPFGIGFDMVIVAMMTSVRVALTAIVESSISQGAWIWVSEARQRHGRGHARLEDFKLYDGASRGL